VSAVPPQVAADSLRAALRAVFAGREYRWTEPSGPWPWLVQWWQRLLEWLDRLHVASPVRYYVVFGFLTLLLVAILGHVVWVVRRSLRPAKPVRASGPGPGPVRDAAWHRVEALRLSAAGRFAEALAHRFVSVVLDLDARRVVQFHPSKTPAEYAAEARLDEGGRSDLADLVASLYRHLFGGTPCGAVEWQQFDARAAGVGFRVAAR